MIVLCNKCAIKLKKSASINQLLTNPKSVKNLIAIGLLLCTKCKFSVEQLLKNDCSK